MAYDDAAGILYLGIILTLTGVGAIIGIPLIIFALRRGNFFNKHLMFWQMQPVQPLSAVPMIEKIMDVVVIMSGHDREK